MPETDQNEKKEFMIEKIKEKPINKKKLLRRTVITAAMAVIFGLVACFTFLVLEPFLSNYLNPKQEPVIVKFPEDMDEMSPEDMLTDNMVQENQASQAVAEVMDSLSLNNDQIQSIINSVVMDKDDLRSSYNSVSNYANELKKSIVTIIGVSSNVDWFNNVQINEVKSYGVIIANNSRELLILADYSPLKKADSLSLTFDNGLNVSAQIKDINTGINLAVVSVNLDDISDEMLENDIAVAPLGSSNAKYVVGTPVIAIGSPMGMQNSINFGVVVGVSGKDSVVDSSFKILQTNMMGSENANGVLFNFNGQVIGIITTDEAEIKNTITAYGITELKKSVEKMSNGEKLPYLGIKGVDVTLEANSEIGVPFGGYVIDVEMDSPAMMAGIQRGDVIIALGEKSVNSFSDYANALVQMKVGEEVKVKVLRQSFNEYKQIEFEMTIRELK